MKIGSHVLKNNLVLAPMAGVTDKPFRQLCKELGAGMLVSEMITTNPALYKTPKTMRRMDHHNESSPVVVQIAGADPDMMAEAARFNEDHGADIIDINMGCPAKKVCNLMAGSALMQNEKLVTQILEAVVNAVSVPVTLKIRSGWDLQNRNALNIGQIAEKSGIQALTVHGRTRACGFSGKAEHETARELKENLSIPIIANGDIDSPRTAALVLRESRADGLMIGRAAQGNPWIFREITHYLETGRILSPPDMEETATVLKKHLLSLYAFYGEYTGVRIARKHIAWYCKGKYKSPVLLARVNSSESCSEQLGIVENYFHSLNEEGLAA